jgi:predicted amino acid racemase
MPPEINHFRIGEAIILGRNVLDRSALPGTRQDGLRVVAEVIELESKPSIPIGPRGQDAFGNQVEFVDRGIRKRALLNVGRQDVDIDGLIPEDEGIIVLGGSSDHLVLDVSDAHTTIKLGDEVGFIPSYSALLAASTSPYVEKVVIQG